MFKKTLNTVDLYTEVHGEQYAYGNSANDLLKEMMANLMALASKYGKLFSNPLTITDYGCGRSNAANVLGWVLNSQGAKMDAMFGEQASYEEVLDMLLPSFEEAKAVINREPLPQIAQYGRVTVQRFDIGIPEYSTPLAKRADVVFCNDVAEHIPYEDIPAFIEALEKAGEFVVMSISLRDAVNYCKLDESLLMAGAEKVEKLPERCIFLNKDASGCYIFSLHVSILPKEEWQDLLGKKWHLLPAQDYTAVSAMNFEVEEGYCAYKRRLIAKMGFVDMISIPTVPGSKYEQDEILFGRTAAIQPYKHVVKLNALAELFDEEDEFAKREKTISLAWLNFMGVELLLNDHGKWEIKNVAPDFVERIRALDKYSKLEGNDPSVIDRRATEYLINATGIEW